MILFYVLCNAGRAGLHLVGGVRPDLRVQSYHLLMVFSEIHLFLILFLHVLLGISVFLLIIEQYEWFFHLSLSQRGTLVSCFFLCFQNEKCLKVEKANLLISL